MTIGWGGGEVEWNGGGLGWVGTERSNFAFRKDVRGVFVTHAPFRSYFIYPFFSILFLLPLFSHLFPSLSLSLSHAFRIYREVDSCIILSDFSIRLQ